MHSTRTLPAFPPAHELLFSGSALLLERGIRVRAADAGDFAFLHELYRDLRADELAPLPWPEATKRAFLDEQFALQHVHFVRHYGAAEFLLIEHAGVPIGRFYWLHRADADFHIVEIALLPSWRGQGIGGGLIRAAQAQAAYFGRDVTLHVDQRNVSARRLYERLGFGWVSEEGVYQMMRWRVPAVS